MHAFIKFFGNHKRLLVFLASAGVIMLAGLVLIYVFVGSYDTYVISKEEAKAKNIKVGVAFGAGVAPSGKPYDELAGRLDGAAELYKDGIIQKIVVSGDNRFVNYNEPQAMQNYLTDEKDIPLEAIQQDNAGRSTYETCERTAKIFGQNQALLITSSSHLPRAIFTCRKLGVESYGVAYGADANNASRREFMARIKAALNIYVVGEKTILGEPIPID